MDSEGKEIEIVKRERHIQKNKGQGKRKGK